MVGRRAENRVEGRLLVEHHPKILVLGAAEIRRLRGVVRLDFPLRRLPAAGALVIKRLKAEGLGGIGHGDDLHVREVQEFPHVLQPAPARAHEGDVDLLARRHETRSAQHVAGQDVERGDSGRRGLDEGATRGGSDLHGEGNGKETGRQPSAPVRRRESVFRRGERVYCPESRSARAAHRGRGYFSDWNNCGFAEARKPGSKSAFFAFPLFRVFAIRFKAGVTTTLRPPRS